MWHIIILRQRMTYIKKVSLWVCICWTLVSCVKMAELIGLFEVGTWGPRNHV